MLKKITWFILIFMFYSFLGWCMEVIVGFIEKRKFINRGFLIGPYCPIYGAGCLLILALLSRFKSEPIGLFIMAIVLCSILEYVTSFVMEKIFKTRWWDYSNKKFNINGRICLDTMIPFGILGCFVIYVVQPMYSKVLTMASSKTLTIISIILSLIFLIDFAISQKLIYSFRKTIKNVEKDSTEEITKKVRDIILEKSYFYKRFIEAFPNMKTAKERLIELKSKISKDIDKLDIKQKRRDKHDENR